MQTTKISVFLRSGDHNGPSTSIVGVFGSCKGVFKIIVIQLGIELQIRISCYYYTLMKIQFKQQPLLKFWLHVTSVYLKKLSQKAGKMLQPFSFSILTHVMNKYRFKLVVQSKLNVSLFKNVIMNWECVPKMASTSVSLNDVTRITNNECDFH